MGYMDIDGQIVIGGTIDGQEITEVSIDGCTFGFEKLMRTGFFSMSDGTREYNLDLTEVNYIVQAGLRYRGKNPILEDAMRYGNYSASKDTGWTGTSYAYAYPTDIPAIPTAPYAAEHLATNLYNVRVYCTRESSYYYKGTAGNNGGDWASFVFPEFPSVALAPGFDSADTGCWGRVRSESSGYRVRGTCQGRRGYWRRYLSADTKMEVNDYSATSIFVLQKDDLAPSGGGSGIIQIPDSSEDWFFGVPLPNTIFNVKQNNEITFTALNGSGSIDIEIFVLYR